MQKKWREKEFCRIKSDVSLAFIFADFINFFFYHHLFSDPESSYPSDEVDVTCKRALCECDSQATKCFANSTFNAANIDYDTSKCWCINNEWKMVRYLNKKKGALSEKNSILSVRIEEQYWKLKFHSESSITSQPNLPSWLCRANNIRAFFVKSLSQFSKSHHFIESPIEIGHIL